jgi:NTE family protein
VRLSGLDRGELSGPHAGLVRFLYCRRIGQVSGAALNMPLHIGASVEIGNVWQGRAAIDANSLVFDGSVSAGVDTYFGLLFLGAEFSEHGDCSFYLFLGDPCRSRLARDN